MSYEIGYRRPPPSGQFQKGKSGNPKGRPIGTANFLTLLEKELNQSVTVTENGQKKSVTRLQAMVKRLVAAALQGDQKGMLTLVEILRRTGGFQAPESMNPLPEDYQDALDAYLKQHSKPEKKPTNHSNGD